MTITGTYKLLKAPQDFQLDAKVMTDGVKVEVAGHEFVFQNPKLSYHYTLANEGRASASHPPGRGVVNEATLTVELDRRRIEVGEIPVPICDQTVKGDDIPGFFRVNGKDILIRRHLVMRKNYPVAFKGKIIFRAVDDSLKSRAVTLRDDGIQMVTRLEVGDGKAANIPVVTLLVTIGKVTEKTIARDILQGLHDNDEIKLYVLKSFRCNDCKTAKSAREFIKQGLDATKRGKDETAMTVDELVKNVMPQCPNDRDKYNILILIVRRFLYYKFKLIPDESLDYVSTTELTLTNDYYCCLVNDRLKSIMGTVRAQAIKAIEAKETKAKRDAEKEGRVLGDDYKAVLNREEAFEFLRSAMTKRKDDVSRGLNTFLSTGNVTREINGCKEKAGITNIVDLNNRQGYISQFFKVAKGSSYQDMKASDMRQIQPYSKGFLCIIESPDGAQCGLIQFICKECQLTLNTVSEKNEVKSRLEKCARSEGLEIRDPLDLTERPYLEAPIIVDGVIVGYVALEHAKTVADHLRKKKKMELDEDGLLKAAWEVAHGPRDWHGPEAVYVFTTSGRMMRPVYYGPTEKILYIGTLEALNLIIRNKCDVPTEDLAKTTRENDDKNMFGHIANFIPFSNHNPGPRVIYQCQMMKQSMGTPSHSLMDRFGPTKMFRIEYPFKPLVRPHHWTDMRMDEYPQGQNCIVALMPYAGMNMEDSIILNRSSVERGLFSAHQFSYSLYHLKDLIPKTSRLSQWRLGLPPNPKIAPEDSATLFKELNIAGFPHLRRPVKESERLFAYYFTDDKTKTEEVRFVKKKKKMPMRIVNYRLFNEGKSICLVMAYPRNPIVGDKFANRAGQKGVCSMVVNEQDLPYFPGLGGVRPDVIFNPHGLASRMTAGMLLEAIAGVVAINEAETIDASAFRKYEVDGVPKDPFDFFNDTLEKAGMPRGSEHVAINGTVGEPLEDRIMVGMIHYQRLRQLVEDKQQARSTKGYDRFTWQPQHGREVGGGLRFGEMERDGLLGHGASDLLFDKTMNQSDLTLAFHCATCGGVYSNSYCWRCEASGEVTKVLVPAASMRIMQLMKSVGLEMCFGD